MIKKVYGPYTRKNGRQQVILIKDDGSKTSMSYPKWLVEQSLGRKLDPNKETIDHIDGDFTNNDFNNLRIIDRSTHSKEDAIRVKLIEIICSWCGEKSLKNGKDLRHNEKQGKAGSFCNKSCAGKYSAEVQNGRISPIGREKTPDSVYYKISKSNKGTRLKNTR